MIVNVKSTATSPSDRRRGLLAYLQIELQGGLILDGITLRRTADCRLTVSFPARTDRDGRRHPFIRPLDDEARVDFERAILTQLGLEDLA